MKSKSIREVFPLLTQGSSGGEVITLQTKLQEHNFNPGSIDGIFGQDTAKALIAFQKSVGLTPDGIAGRNTWAALNRKRQDCTLDTGLFTVDAVSQIFYDAPRSNIVKYLPLILNALEKLDLGDRNMVLIALSTIRAESASFAPISEFRSRYNTTPGKHAFNRYDFRADLGNGALGDGAKYKGRGFIQLTGKANYRRYSRRLGLGTRLVNNPELANDPKIAADLLAYFLKDKENVIRQDLAKSNLRAARRRVNGGTHGIQQFTTAFRTGAGLLRSNRAIA
ncbi:peptidoglycan-binding protein [Pleurocapsa sp. PCC 7319]|uniref:peptidoglycan-binding protein n=1 Tax=Pleurocapsa sp. PCC 7319 TaxID=118161 RepID=UPI00034782C7|nr:peptidoglycan-binding protein [Pleurocapsa sp. PCC 7319]